MSTGLRDLRHAGRSLLRKRGFTAVVLLTIALGVGANTTLFSVVDGVLLRPLPYEDPERLVNIWQTLPAWKDSPHANMRSWWNQYPISYSTLQSWLGQSRFQENPVFESLGLYTNASHTVTGGDRPEPVRGYIMTSGVFGALGVNPSLGRTFLPEDDELGADRVAVLSHSYWQRGFGGDPSVVGETLRLDKEPHTIVGVMPAGFYFPKDCDLWTTLADEAKQEGAGRLYHGVARLQPGITLGQAQREMEVIAAGVDEMVAGQEEHGARLVSRLDEVVGEVRPALLMLLSAVGLVLLIACANVANLLLIRATERRRELAVRAALGAGRGRLVTLLLGESLMLSLAGGALGFALAFVALEPLTRFLPPGLPRAAEVTLDHRVLLFSLAVTLVTGLLIGVLPALGASRSNLSEVLGDSARTGGQKRQRTQAILVISEIALAFLLVVGASLLAKSLVRLEGVERGFEAKNVLLMRIHPPEERYPEDRLRAFFTELHQELAALPGVTRVAGADTPPFHGGFKSGGATVETASGPVETQLEFTSVTASYFDTLEVPILAGRPFDERDHSDAIEVIMVSKSMAEEQWPGESPLGRRVKLAPPDSDDPWLTVVGVAADVHHQALDVAAKPRLYRPEAQSPFRGQSLLLATQGNPSSIAALARNTIWELDPELPINSVGTLQERISRSIAVPRFRTFLITLLAGLAAVLALVGIYGVMAYAVTQRTHEIGVRMALGARRADILCHVLVRATKIAGIGLGIGLVLTAFSVRLLESFLFEMSSYDAPLTALALVLLGSSALLASLVPARRAAAVDPAVTLRE